MKQKVRTHEFERIEPQNDTCVNDSQITRLIRSQDRPHQQQQQYEAYKYSSKYNNSRSDYTQHEYKYQQRMNGRSQFNKPNYNDGRNC